jgi:uncharacterized protein YndB with AHSA1/START domain
MSMDPMDPTSTAAAVDREVRTGERDGVTTRVVVARRTYPAPQAELWDAVTNPERLPRWFLPVSGELRPGGRYQLEGNAGGTVEACEEPERFAVTWEFGGQVSWVTVTLAPRRTGTTLEVAHEAPVDPAFWEQYGPGATGVGWDLGLLGLDRHLAAGSEVAVAAAAAAAWPTTPEGVAYVRHAAGAWVAAAVEDGDDPTVAEAAGERTVVFYTVPPEA